ncbi:uncharacterized protein DS421_20g696070 [Arachis hypogaea]|nr:uncharacterized protein DS421_20g696070 [Arachis hypogaea]
MECPFQLTNLVANCSPTTPAHCRRRSSLLVAVQCFVFLEETTKMKGLQGFFLFGRRMQLEREYETGMKTKRRKGATKKTTPFHPSPTCHTNGQVSKSSRRY